MFSFLIPPRSFDPAHPEMVDSDTTPADVVREEMLLLAKANARLGGRRLVLDYVAALARTATPGPLTILDLGTGSADVPRAIVEWARRNNRRVAITASDINPRMLQLAHEACAGFPEITIERQDLRALPHAARSFDLVLCSLALHHFTMKAAEEILRRIGEITRVGYIVQDLRRNRGAVWITHLASRVLVRNELLRHDALQSARAAFTVGELYEMAERAGLKNFEIKRHHGMFKMVLAARI